MKDLIERRAAIERATQCHDFYKGATIPTDKARRDELLNVMCWLGELPSAQPDEEKISDALYNIYRNKGTSTSAEGVAAIKYYIAEIWREIYGEEGPRWMKIDFHPHS